CSPIGIDVGARSIKAAQLGRAGRAWGVRTLARLTRSTPGLPGAAEAVRLADSLGRLGFQGRRVVLAVPEDRLLTSVFELPPRSSGAPLEQMAIMELARSVRRDARSLEAACWEVPAPTRAGAGTHLMAA